MLLSASGIPLKLSSHCVPPFLMLCHVLDAQELSSRLQPFISLCHSLSNISVQLADPPFERAIVALPHNGQVLQGRQLMQVFNAL